MSPAEFRAFTPRSEEEAVAYEKEVRLRQIDFRKMSPAEFKAFKPRSEEEAWEYEKEDKFRQWCKLYEEDPANEESRENYDISERESGDAAWDDMDEDDKAGWIDNMNKDPD